MKRLITGANGFLGVALVECLLSHKVNDLRLLVRQNADRRGLDAVLARHPGVAVDVVAGSLDTAAAAAALVADVDLVYHLAAVKRGSLGDIANGTLGSSRHLLDAIVASGRAIRVVLVSSFSVYDTAALEPDHLITETTPLERQPARRDAYSHAKLEQEVLFRAYHARHAVPLTVLRPGVIYGRDSAQPSQRVGLLLPGNVLLFAGRDNALPLTYVDNCAEALRVAGENAKFDGDTYNVVDDDAADGASPTCRSYLAHYRATGRHLIVLPLAWTGLLRMARVYAWLRKRTRNAIPAFVTPYQVRATWKPQRYSNAALRSLGFTPPVATGDALRRTFDSPI